jgi:hypothetical protein
MLTSVKDRLKAFIQYKNLTTTAFCSSIGVSSAFVSSMSKSMQPDKVERIAEAYPELNVSWLLTGSGVMLNHFPSVNPDGRPSQVRSRFLSPLDGIPLVSDSDSTNGHFCKECTRGECLNCPRYLIPDFQRLGAQFLIRVSGNSMYPKYANGDVLACRLVPKVSFLQWGKPYVIDTDQGVLVKRFFETDNPERVICVSDNKSTYPPFAMNRSDISGLAVVVGMVRVE